MATIPFAELLEDVRNRYHDDPQKAQAWLQAVAQTQRREYEAQAEAQRKQAKAQYDAEYEAGRRHAQAAEDTIALGHFVESGAHLVYNPATKKVYFSDAEAAAAREAALRAALSVGERH
ncbi:MAG: hypothetical protein DLM52_12270 [Chthoniobacterales bacterium]|nr:MAG: hypothetical protein DLM52_12270 [Chthoniobacterales bacterium]